MTKHHAMKSRAREEFEAWADSYDAHYLNHFLFKPSYRVFLEEIYRWRGYDGPGFDMLDVGCGSGTLACMIAATRLPIVRLVALDYAAQMCRVARDKARGLKLDTPQFLNADSEHLPFADGSFDVITCGNSFHHYPHQQDVVTEMRRVLRPGGRLMIIDGFRDNVVGWMTFDVCIGAVEGEIYHAEWSTMNRYFKDAGFRTIRHRKFSFWFPGLLTVGVA